MKMWMLRPRSIGLLLALMTLLVYLPATRNGFINFDDQDYVTKNHVVQKGLTWEGVKWAFDGVHFSNWHPLTWLSHMLDCDLFHLNPAGPHLVNILFHALNTTLLFALMWCLTKKLWPSAFIAALFAWHPLHVESVAWVAERKDVLSTFFALLALLCYVRHAKSGGSLPVWSAATGRRFPTTRQVMSFQSADMSAHSKPEPGSQLVANEQTATCLSSRFYWLALFFFALALLSKPMPVTLPLVMLLLDFWPLGRVTGAKWQVVGSVLRLTWEKWPFFLCTFALCVVTFLAQQDTAVSSLKAVSLGFRLENMVTAYAGYLWKMIWPMHLGMFYPVAPIPTSWLAASIIVLVGISIIVWLERKLSPWLITGWLWFLVTLIPVIGIVQVGRQAMADRYTYFPLIGIFLAIVFTLQAVVARFRFLKPCFAVAGFSLLIVCIWLTEKQISYWHDSETLYTHTLAIEDSATIRISLGAALQDQGRMSEAMAEYIRSFRLDNTSTLVWSDMAWMLDHDGKPEMAVIYYQEAVKRRPRSPSVYNNYGLVLAKLGRSKEAMDEFAAAARMDVRAARPQYLMGWLLLQQGHDIKAMSYLHQALRLEPDNLEVLILTASVLAADENPQVRNGAEARKLAERAVNLTNGQQAAPFDTLAMSYAETGRFDKAVQFQKQAIKLANIMNQKEDVALMQQRLRLYEKKQPWRGSFVKK